MLKQKISLRTFLMQNFRFASESTGDELSVQQVTTRVNHSIEEFVVASDVEACLADLARNKGYEPTRCYIYPLPATTRSH